MVVDLGLKELDSFLTKMVFIYLVYNPVFKANLHFLSVHYNKSQYLVDILTANFITLHYITLHYITLHFITLHYISSRPFTMELRVQV